MDAISVACVACVACVGISMTTTGSCVKQSWGRIKPKRKTCVDRSRIAELESMVYSIPTPQSYDDWQMQRRYKEMNSLGGNFPRQIEYHEAQIKEIQARTYPLDWYISYLENVEYHPTPPADIPRLRLLPQLSEDTQTSFDRRRA